MRVDDAKKGTPFEIAVYNTRPTAAKKKKNTIHHYKKKEMLPTTHWSNAHKFTTAETILLRA